MPLYRSSRYALLSSASQYPSWLLTALAWFDPSDQTTLFQDSAGTTPVTTDGQSVGLMLDKSGNGNHASQSNNSLRPVYRTSGGLSWISFNGTNQYLQINSGLDARTIVAAASTTTAGQYKTLFGVARSGSSPAVAPIYFQMSQGIVRAPGMTRTTSADTSDGSDLFAPWNATASGEVYVLSGTVEPGSPNIVRIRKNLNTASYTSSSNSLNALGSASYLGAGQYGGTVTDFCACNLYHFTIYPTVLAQSAWDAAVIYAGAKAGVSATATKPTYTISHFQKNSENLMLSQSDDAITWRRVPCSYSPSVGSVRDPSIRYDSGTGLWWVVHTSGAFGASSSFELANSSDGVNFTTIAQVDCSGVLPGGSANRVWAPEWFIDDDGSVHVFVAACSTYGTAYDFKIYETHPTNAGLTSWSTPVQVTGTSLPTTMIDAFVVSKNNSPDGKYHIWYVDGSAAPSLGTSNVVCRMSSNSLTSGYTIDKSGDWAGWGLGYEGEALIKRGDGTWLILLDALGNGMYYSTSSDWVAWSAKVAVTAGRKPEHGTIVVTP